MGIKITAREEDIEKLIEEIGTKNLEIEGRGFLNTGTEIVGIMLYVKNDPTKIIDLFLTIEKDDFKGEGVDTSLKE